MMKDGLITKDEMVEKISSTDTMPSARTERKEQESPNIPKLQFPL
jgi:hypothetical protein